jgi:hypothetical protein
MQSVTQVYDFHPNPSDFRLLNYQLALLGVLRHCYTKRRAHYTVSLDGASGYLRSGLF